MDTIDGIFKREGSSYTDHKTDRGGPTRWGITLRTLKRWRRRHGQRKTTADDVKALTKDEARRIYQDEYIDQPGFNRVRDLGLREHLIDIGVLHGQATAIRWIQKLVGAKVDGKLGPKTANRINRAQAIDLSNELMCHRLRKSCELVTKSYRKALRDGVVSLEAGLQAANAWGWANRQTGFLRKCGH